VLSKLLAYAPNDVGQLNQNRSFAAGKKIFREANFTGHLFSKSQSGIN